MKSLSLCMSHSMTKENLVIVNMGQMLQVRVVQMGLVVIHNLGGLQEEHVLVDGMES